MANNNSKKRRYAKAYGVKSNVYIGDLIYTTTFGNKNEGKLSKITDPKKDYSQDNFKVEEKDENSEFDMFKKEDELSVSLKSGKSNNVNINNPIKNPKADIIKINNKINELIFEPSSDLKDDNVRIQIGYNILDMNKIISLYYYDIVYALNNLTRNADVDKDFIGNLNFHYSLDDPSNPYNPYYDTNPDLTYEEIVVKSEDDPQGFYKFDKYAKSSYGYFPVFKQYKNNAANDDKIKIQNEENKKYNFNLLRVLSFIRQSIAHSKEENTQLNCLYKVNNDNSVLSEDLKKVDNSVLPEDLKKVINRKFVTDLNSINKSFNSNAKVNLYIIKKVTGIDDDTQLLEDYYNFSLKKENKNIGINATAVREELFELYKKKRIDLSNHKYDSFRPKLNLIYDFLIYDFLKNKSEMYVNQLRKTASSDDRDEAKKDIYREIAKTFFESNKQLISNGYELVSNNIDSIIKNKHKNEIIDAEITLTNIKQLNPDNYSLFSRLIYFITYFLEKKEKNDLITALVNKLDNIDSLNKLYSTIMHTDIVYKEDYRLFADASKIASELRIIKNLSHMESQLDKASGIIYEDVLRSLGFNGDKSECQSIISKFESDHSKHPFRNFIINNVVKSRRYKYIAKYIDPKHCQGYIKNENLVKNILRMIPESQLDRYYKRLVHINNSRNISIANKIDTIYTQLKNVNYNFIEGNVCKNIKENEKTKKYTINPIRIEDTKSLINLYYTVIYLAVKNLVNINSIFTIAFECLERDYAIVNSQKKDVYDNRKSELSLIKEYALDFYKNKNKHNYDYLIKNVKEFESASNIGSIFKSIRNNVIHMSIVNKAHEYLNEIKLESNPKSKLGKDVPVYYDLYIYVLEKLTFKKCGEITFNNKKYNDKTVYNHYDKDLLKVLLIPFGYNLARYKNLTIRDLFYDQYKDNIKEDKNINEINNN